MGMLDQSTKLDFQKSATGFSIGDTPSTNVYDTADPNSTEIGLNDNLWLNAQVNTAITSGGSATLQAVLQDSADNSAWADVLAGPVVTLANLVAGTQLLLVNPPVGTRRYVRVVWRVATAALTGGTLSAFLSLDAQKNVFRNSGFAVV